MSGDTLYAEGEPLPPFVVSLAERFNLAFKEAPEGATPAEAERECNLLLAALKEAMDEQAAHQRARDFEVQRADQFLARVNRGPKEREAWLHHMLAAVAPYVPRFGKKSRDLPHGTIGWRKKAERIVIEDPAAVVAWAKEHGLTHLLKTDESLPHAAVESEWKRGRALIPDYIPPGCKVVEAEEAFHAEAKDVA